MSKKPSIKGLLSCIDECDRRRGEDRLAALEQLARLVIKEREWSRETHSIDGWGKPACIGTEMEDLARKGLGQSERPQAEGREDQGLGEK